MDDPTWQELIGATQTNIVPTGNCTCYFEGYYGGEEIEVCSGPCETLDCNLCDWTQEDFNIVVTQHPSDGFILVESAMNGPGVNYPIQKMDGSNHMQMKNDSNMKDAVKKIFEQSFGDYEDGYFYTEKR